MKANEAPEKIYFLLNGLISCCRNTDEDVEYTKTDALIEKACEFMGNNIDKQLIIYHNNTWRKRDEFIEAFRQFMKGD